MTLKLRVDWSRMVYSPAGSSNLFLIVGCMTSARGFALCILAVVVVFFYGKVIPSSFFAKLNKPPSLLSPPPPSNVF